MTPTLWLLAALGFALGVALVGHWLNIQQRRADAKADAEYRTADAEQMARDVRKLRNDVPSPRTTGINTQQVRATAVSAAIRDMGKKTTTPNPYQPASRAHGIWQENYDRVTRDQVQLQSEMYGDESHVEPGQLCPIDHHNV